METISLYINNEGKRLIYGCNRNRHIIDILKFVADEYNTKLDDFWLSRGGFHLLPTYKISNYLMNYDELKIHWKVSKKAIHKIKIICNKKAYEINNDMLFESDKYYNWLRNIYLKSGILDICTFSLWNEFHLRISKELIDGIIRPINEKTLYETIPSKVIDFLDILELDELTRLAYLFEELYLTVYYDLLAAFISYKFVRINLNVKSLLK